MCHRRHAARRVRPPQLSRLQPAGHPRPDCDDGDARGGCREAARGGGGQAQKGGTKGSGDISRRSHSGNATRAQTKLSTFVVRDAATHFRKEAARFRFQIFTSGGGTHRRREWGIFTRRGPIAEGNGAYSARRRVESGAGESSSTLLVSCSVVRGDAPFAAPHTCSSARV
eukprot:322723-Prorocentrum_minimum.AAC.2